jgi:hypothetical protein
LEYVQENTPFEIRQLMLALSQAAGHSERSLTTTYETIAYHIHCSSSRRWLDDVMRQQERIHDDNQLDVQLKRRDHEEGHGREERDEYKEDDNDQKEDLDEKEERYRGRSVCFSISYPVIARYAALSRQAQHFGEGAPIDGGPR